MKTINSPIVITIIVIISAFILKSQSKPNFEGAYEQLISIAEDAGSDPEKTKVIQKFAEQIASRLKVGFSRGFSSDDESENRDEKFLRVKKNINVTDVKEIQSEWQGRQSTMFRVENKSKYPITQIRVNLEFYKNGELIDVKNEHLHEIKVLDSGESFTAKKDRKTPNQLSDAEKKEFAFDDVKVAITSFHITE